MNYRGDGPWLDWVNILWEHNDPLTNELTNSLVPAQLQCFVQDPHTLKIYAIIWSCDYEPDRASVFLQKFDMEIDESGDPVCQKVDVNCLREHVCVFPWDRQMTQVFQVMNQDDWWKEFTNTDYYATEEEEGYSPSEDCVSLLSDGSG